jgi:cytochrome c-type biogenesis protein CcsB
MENHILKFFLIETNNIQFDLLKKFSRLIINDEWFHSIKEIFFFKTINYDFISSKNYEMINKIMFKSFLTLGQMNFSLYSTDNNVENFLRNLSFGLLFFAMIYFWTQTAFTSLTKVKLGNFLIFAANLALSFLLLLRWKLSGHFPLSNLYESLMFLSWSCTTLYFLIINMLERPNSDPRPFTLSGILPFLWQKSSGTVLASMETGKGINSLSNSNQQEKNNNFDIQILTHKAQTISLDSSINDGEQLNNKSIFLFFSTKKTNEVNTEIQKKIIGCIISPVALLMNAYATFSLPSEMQQASPLVPALQSNWLMMHVTVMILSYAGLILGSLFAMAFLILNFFSNTKSHENKKNNQISFSKQMEIQKEDLFIKIIENLDNYSYRIIGIGFSLLTIGILSGAVWANEAWGSYWSWDPKETWALLTWLVYAIYLHTRFTKGWQGQKPAIIASVGFIMVWVCFLGVNLIGKGLHSYGFFN